MINDLLLYMGSAVIIIWGVAHIIPTKAVVKGFGKISDQNRRIITMEWVAEGMALCFIGILVLLITIFEGSENPASIFAYRVSAVMTFVVGLWTFIMGWKTSIVPIKICPLILTCVAVLFFLGSVL